MDPLSLAASVVGIISLGIQVTQGLVDFYSAYSSQKSDIAHTLKKLDRLLDVLKTLREQLGGREFSENEQALHDNITSAVQDCDECVRELQSELDRFKDKSAEGKRAAARTAACANFGGSGRFPPCSM